MYWPKGISIIAEIAGIVVPVTSYNEVMRCLCIAIRDFSSMLTSYGNFLFWIVLREAILQEIVLQEDRRVSHKRVCHRWLSHRRYLKQVGMIDPGRVNRI